MHSESRCLAQLADGSAIRESEQALHLLSGNPELKEVADIVRYLNENFDRSGTPLGLIGDQIPLGARIVRIAREYDLLTNPKDSVQALSHEKAVASLKVGRRTDPGVLEALAELTPAFS